MTELNWSETTGTVARDAGVPPDLVRQYANDGLIESQRLPNGTRLFRADAANKVRALKAERLARCGRYERKATRTAT